MSLPSFERVISINGKNYKQTYEIGRGTNKIVYLYEEEMKEAKVAIKTPIR